MAFRGRRLHLDRNGVAPAIGRPVKYFSSARRTSAAGVTAAVRALGLYGFVGKYECAGDNAASPRWFVKFYCYWFDFVSFTFCLLYLLSGAVWTLGCVSLCLVSSVDWSRSFMSGRD